MLYARRKGWTLDRIEAQVSRAKIDAADPTAGPAVGKTDTIQLELILGGDLTPEQERRLREVADRCPVHKALAGQTAITHDR